MKQYFKSLEEKHSILLEDADYLFIKSEIDKMEAQYQLGEISKTISKTFKEGELKRYVEEMIKLKAKIIDQFCLAYIAEKELSPSQVQFVQHVDEHGAIEMFFEEKRSILL